MSRRIGLLAAALVVAMFGTMAVFAYVSRVESKAMAGQEPVNVLMASGRIAQGTTVQAALERKLVTVESLPRNAVPEGALTSLKDMGPQSAVSDIFPGEILLPAKFAEVQARTGSLVIPKGHMAVSVKLGDPQRVAGFVLPGSEVAIFATVERVAASVKGSATQTTSANTTSASVDVEATVDDKMTRLLLPRTSVIGVGPSTLRPADDEEAQANAPKGKEKPIATAVLTVAVTQAEAEKLVHAAQTGDLYFGLLTVDSKTGPSQGVSNNTLFK